MVPTKRHFDSQEGKTADLVYFERGGGKRVDRLDSGGGDNRLMFYKI